MSAQPARPRTERLEDMPITRLKGVGASLAEKLGRIGIHKVLDLLFHLPLRYQDRTRVTPLGALRHGDDVVVEGTIVAASVVFGRRRSLLCKIQDGTGMIALRFFYFNAAQKNSLQPDKRIRCAGECRRGASGLEIYHPEYRLLDDNEPQALEQTLTPIYPATEGLQQPRLRGLMAQAFVLLRNARSLPDYLPEALIREMAFVPLTAALIQLHKPPADLSLARLQSGQQPAQQRLAFEELLAHHLSLRQLRDQTRRQPAPVLATSRTLVPALLASLPFSLTAAQQRVCKEVCADLQQPHPMLRLVQGDVGSGKTLVAIIAALQAVENGFQAVIMAPTEILAEQHYLNFCTWLEPLGITCTYLSGKIKGKKRDLALYDITSGSAGIVVGTHALFQDDVNFHYLGLLVVDEQHRFGVHQRLALREKGIKEGHCPHQLIMTATPIPRTLTMSAYADLDNSVIDELPPGRTPVNTVVLPDNRRPDVISRIREACGNGRQAYWVCTLIEESEQLQCQAAEATHAELTEQLVELGIGLIHGRMKPTQKTEVMEAFKRGELQLLVATTVIEVGVDVPNASLMIIENPERLGLAQLHQLRGRVGRGDTKSHCILLYKTPLSGLGKQRLSIMRQSNDGFFIAEQDLKIRGPGEILGTRQTGLMDFRMADLVRDSHLQPAIRKWADILRREQPEVIEPLIRRWIADKQRYAQV